MYCKNCNKEIDDNLKSCPFCGNNLSEQDDYVNYWDNLNDNDDNNKNDYNNNVDAQKKENQDIVRIDKQSKNNKKLFISVGVVAILIALIAVIGVFGKEYFLPKKDPVDRLIDSSYDLIKAKTSEITSEISLADLNLGTETQDANTQLGLSIIKEAKIKTIIKQDRDKDKYEMDLVILLRDNELTKANIYLDKELIIVNIPDFYDQPFYITWEDLSNVVSQQTGKKITFQEYVNMLTDLENMNSIKAFDADKYVQVYKDNYKDKLQLSKNEKVEVNGKEMKLDKISIKVDYKDSINLSKEIIKIAISDKQIDAIVEELFNKVIKTLETTGDLDEAMLEEAKKGLDEYKNNKEKYIAEMEKVLKQPVPQDMVDGAEYNYNFYYKGNELKKMDIEGNISTIEPTTNEKVNMTVIASTTINSLNKSIKFIEIDKNKSVNAGKVSKEEWKEILEKIMDKARTFMFNPAFSDILGGGQQ